MKLLLYCTKSKPYLYKHFKGDYFVSNTYEKLCINNGKIVAECDFEVEKIIYRETEKNSYSFGTDTLTPDELLDKSCMTTLELCKYIGSNPNWTKGDYGYAIHIKNLHIFDKPKELKDYTTKKVREWDSIVCDSCTAIGVDCKKCSYYYAYQEVCKAPQNMMKVCEWDVKDNVLISIHPEWLCKILNGEKTIEIRKKVLKEML